MSCSCVSNITGVVIEKKREKERRITVYANAENGCIRTHAFWARLQKKKTVQTQKRSLFLTTCRNKLNTFNFVWRARDLSQNTQLVAKTDNLSPKQATVWTRFKQETQRSITGRAQHHIKSFRSNTTVDIIIAIIWRPTVATDFVPVHYTYEIQIVKPFIVPEMTLKVHQAY